MVKIYTQNCRKSGLKKRVSETIARNPTDHNKHQPNITYTDCRTSNWWLWSFPFLSFSQWHTIDAFTSTDVVIVVKRVRAIDAGLRRTVPWLWCYISRTGRRCNRTTVNISIPLRWCQCLRTILYCASISIVSIEAIGILKSKLILRLKIHLIYKFETEPTSGKLFRYLCGR